MVLNKDPQNLKGYMNQMKKKLKDKNRTKKPKSKKSSASSSSHSSYSGHKSIVHSQGFNTRFTTKSNLINQAFLGKPKSRKSVFGLNTGSMRNLKKVKGNAENGRLSTDLPAQHRPSIF